MVLADNINPDVYSKSDAINRSTPLYKILCNSKALYPVIKLHT